MSYCRSTSGPSAPYILNDVEIHHNGTYMKIPMVYMDRFAERRVFYEWSFPKFAWELAKKVGRSMPRPLRHLWYDTVIRTHDFFVDDYEKGTWKGFLFIKRPVCGECWHRGTHIGFRTPPQYKFVCRKCNNIIEDYGLDADELARRRQEYHDWSANLRRKIQERDAAKANQNP